MLQVAGGWCNRIKGRLFFGITECRISSLDCVGCLKGNLIWVLAFEVGILPTWEFLFGGVLSGRDQSHLGIATYIIYTHIYKSKLLIIHVQVG